MWAAEVTAAGRAYLAQVDGPNAPVPRQASTSVTEQLVHDAIAAGGSLRVPRRSWSDRKGVDYENRARLAVVYGKVPAGKRLVVTVASPQELQIDLVDTADGSTDAPRPVPVPAKVRRYYPVVRAFRERSEHHEVGRVGRSGVTSANGWETGSCGLPLQQTCPHPNACLTCDHFLAIGEFLPIDQEQLDRTRELLADTRERDQQGGRWCIRAAIGRARAEHCHRRRFYLVSEGK